MARKIECDRCGKQWVNEPHDEEQKELCHLGVDIPWMNALPPTSKVRGWTDQPRINESYDLCQKCARAVHKFATTKPEEYGDIS